MFNGLQKQWWALKCGKPGHRFQELHLRRQELRRGPLTRLIVKVVGAMIFFAGIVLLPLPGPGTLVALLGASLFAQESYGTARALDWLEVRFTRLMRWGFSFFGRA